MFTDRCLDPTRWELREGMGGGSNKVEVFREDGKDGGGIVADIIVQHLCQQPRRGPLVTRLEHETTEALHEGRATMEQTAVDEIYK